MRQVVLAAIILMVWMEPQGLQTQVMEAVALKMVEERKQAALAAAV
jgi:hypothetical protein